MKKKKERLEKSILWRLTWVGLFLATFACNAMGGIPEPSLLMYGIIRNNLSGANVRLTSGTLAWTITREGGSPLTLQTTLTNINDQFSYALQVPLESPMSGIAPDPDALQLSATSAQFDRSQVTIDGAAASIVLPATNTFSLSQRDRGKFERVDLQAQLVFPDGDRDGLPDFWETEYFGGNSATPDGDDDQDGLNNLKEYLAGTHPKSSESSIVILDTKTFPNGDVVLRWQSATNRFYKILRSQNLLSGFSPLVEGIAATPPVNTFTDTNAVSQGPYFYRIKVE
jgi:hypothetical protein